MANQIVHPDVGAQQCVIDGCGKVRKSKKDFCSMHEARIRRHGSPFIVKKPRHINTICEVGGCEKLREKSRFCNAHYLRWVRKGDVGDVSTKRQWQPNTDWRDESVARLFWSQVAVTANPDRCWEWQGGYSGVGYGKFYCGRHYTTHRFSLMLKLGRELNAFALHSCDNKKCVNPNHLREGSHQDNMNDARDRSRHSHGERSATAKLTEDQVREIRRRVEGGEVRKEIAKELGVNPSRVTDIMKGRSWKHLV